MQIIDDLTPHNADAFAQMMNTRTKTINQTLMFIKSNLRQKLAPLEDGEKFDASKVMVARHANGDEIISYKGKDFLKVPAPVVTHDIKDDGTVKISATFKPIKFESE